MKNSNLQDEITVILVLYKESFDLISKTLYSLKSFKKIIIDNDNNIDLKKKIISNFNIDNYILNKKNIGFSAGYNQGIKNSKTIYTLVLGPDCIIMEQDILLLKERLITNQNCLIVSATSYDENRNLTYTGGPLPENCEKNYVLNISGDVCVEATLGACMFFKTKEILQNNLLFDENFFLYYSDVDLCRRIKVLEKSIIQVFDAKAIHQHGILKVKNIYLKKFIREFNFTHDQYYYYYKINKHNFLLDKFKKKIPSLITKFVIKLLTLKFLNCVEIISRLYSYYKFKSKFK
jgi:GT2 family glycosyltransferase|tara:strand:+ start:503 stop:1375 length:873 start_codon:yes stop_codon:yes gene_type:complete